MTRGETLKTDQITDVLLSVIQEKADVVLSFTRLGKWYLHHTQISRFDQESIFLKENTGAKDLTIDQPVGISLKHEFSKYLFEAPVIGFEPSINQSCGGKIVFELPERVECMQRRAYFRVFVPSSLNVETLFWHRGYDDGTAEVPVENYWQGKLIDLSAGGVQIAVGLEQESNFRTGQLMGLQFTPMPYEKPILAEGQVRHIAKSEDGSQLYIGVQFIGLEATEQGREKLRRVSEVVDEYHKLAQAQEQESVASTSE